MFSCYINKVFFNNYTYQINVVRSVDVMLSRMKVWCCRDDRVGSNPGSRQWRVVVISKDKFNTSVIVIECIEYFR